MRILNQNNDQSVKSILIMLTAEEALELKDGLERLLVSKASHKIDHEHINDSSYIHELTIAIYSKENVAEFNPRVQKLLEQDI